MEFSGAEMFGASDVIAAAGAQPGLRLFAVQKNQSGTPRADIIESQFAGGWVETSPQTICGAEYETHDRFCEPHCGPSASVESFKRDTWGYFSAACYVHGLELLKSTGRPQGLLESCWGGTPIEAWSSPAALAKCHGARAGPSVSSARLPLGPDFGAGYEAGTSASALWNAMVNPLLGVPIRGALWYQGEAFSKHSK